MNQQLCSVARVACLLLVITCLSSSAAAVVMETVKQIDVAITTDKPVYDPGEVLTLYLNISNVGNKTLFVKEAHVTLYAETWLGVAGYEETRSITLPIVPGDHAGGYSKVNLPLYAPPGRYRIDAWITYGDSFNETHVVMPYDMRTPTISSYIEVQVGLVFLLAALIVIWFVVRYVILTRIKVKPAVEERTFDDLARKQLSKSLEKVIVIACILGVSLTLVWVGNVQRGSDYFSVVYIKPDSYTGFVDKSMVSFTYGVMCFEEADTKYSLETYLGDDMVAKKDFELCTEGNQFRLTRFEDEEFIKIPDKITYPSKVSLILRTRDHSYETHFWLKGGSG
jgi:hypothetical protein